MGPDCSQSELLPKAVQRNGGPWANLVIDGDVFLGSGEGQNKSLVGS